MADNIETLSNRAIQFFQAGNLAEAERVSSQISALSAGNFTACYILGLAAYQRGENAKALGFLERALAAEPGRAELLTLRGLVLQKSGRLEEALASLDKVIRIKPDMVEAHNNRGNTLCDMGRHAAALQSYDKAASLQPRYAPTFYNRGVALQALGRFDEALQSYGKALEIKPDFFEALNNRGVILQQLYKFQLAFADFEKALTIRPGDFDVRLNQAGTLRDMNRLEEALLLAEELAAERPDSPEAQNNLGTVLHRMKRHSQALESFDRALALKPGDSEALYNRGVALQGLTRHEEALAVFDSVLAGKPDFAEAMHGRGNSLWMLKGPAAALECFDRALRTKESYPEALNSRGLALAILRRPDEALASYSRALGIRPDFAEALANRGNLRWQHAKDYEGAVRDLEAALAADPDYAYARGDLLHLHMHACAWDGFDHDLAIVEDGVRSGRKIVRPFIYQAVAIEPSALKACSKIYADDLYPPAARTPLKTHGGKRKLRIGYMSGEFREQATAYLAAGLYELHDKDQFDIIALDTGTDDGSPMRKRLEAAFSKMIKLSHDSDKGAAEKIAAEEIDILVNLNGYFGDGRMGICAHRPAPIQVNYLGFPATLGADYIDYIIADHVVIPEHERGCYSEKVVTLPHSYQVNDSRRALPEAGATRAEHGLPEDAFVFCNFNQSYKLTPAMFSVWVRLLKRVEGSVLWLLESNKWQSQNLRAELARQDIAPGRIVFAPMVAPEKHLARLALADLFVDSLPYNAHTTASDALWTGVPLLTCLGGAFPGHVAASVLEAAGMPELITSSLAEYESLAPALVRDKDRLSSLRQRLEQNRRTSPLFNTDAYRLGLESAYRTMWELHEKGEGPRNFAVQSLTRPLA